MIKETSFRVDRFSTYVPRVESADPILRDVNKNGYFRANLFSIGEKGFIFGQSVFGHVLNIRRGGKFVFEVCKIFFFIVSLFVLTCYGYRHRRTKKESLPWKNACIALRYFDFHCQLLFSSAIQLSLESVKFCAKDQVFIILGFVVSLHPVTGVSQSCNDPRKAESLTRRVKRWHKSLPFYSRFRRSLCNQSPNGICTTKHPRHAVSGTFLTPGMGSSF